MDMDNYKKAIAWLNPDKYEKTNTPTNPKRIGQVFYLRNGNRPAVITSKVTKADDITNTGKIRSKTRWHYTYLKHSEWNILKGGYFGRDLDFADMVEAKYIGDKDG